MPELPVYTSPKAVQGLQPSDLGVSGYEQMGRHIGATFRELGHTIGTDVDIYEQHQAQQDISQLTSEFAGVFSKATMSWNQEANSGDPNTIDERRQKWVEGTLEPMLEQFGTKTNSRAGEIKANELRNQLRLHFAEKTLGDVSSVSGVAVEGNLTQGLNALSNAVEADPSSFATATTLFGGLIDAQVKAHDLTPEAAARIREDLQGKAGKTLATSAVLGSAQQNPTQALSDLDSGKYAQWFDGEETSRLRKAIIEQGNVNDTLIRRQNKEALDTDAAKLTASIVSPDGTLVIPKTFLGDVAKLSATYAGKPGAAENLPSLTRSLIDLARSVSREGTPTITDPHTYSDFKGRLALGADDPHALTDLEIINARTEGKLSDKDYNFFREAISTLSKDPGYKSAQTMFKEFLAGIKPSIVHSSILMGNNDPQGNQRFLQMEQNFTDQFETAYKKGDGSWKQLLLHDTKGGFWDQSKAYQTDQKGAMGGLQDRISGTPGIVPAIHTGPHPQRNPGESTVDFLKRTGG